MHEPVPDDSRLVKILGLVRMAVFTCILTVRGPALVPQAPAAPKRKTPQTRLVR